MDEEDYILLKDLSQFYLRPIYMFKNSMHIFDNEDSIYDILNDYRILDGNEEIKNYTFVNSQTNPLTQLSDVFVGIMGKLKNYINSSSIEKINNDLNSLSTIQKTNIKLLFDIIDESNYANKAFLHNTDSYEEMSKMEKIMKFHA